MVADPAIRYALSVLAQKVASETSVTILLVVRVGAVLNEEKQFNFKLKKL